MKVGEYVWEDQLTWDFLEFYKNNLEKFRNPQIRNKDLFSKICEEMLEKYPNEPLTAQLLTKKFFNMKRTHEKIYMKKKSAMETYEISWKFFDSMTEILSGDKSVDLVIDVGLKADTSLKVDYAWKDNVTFAFLDLYLERIEQFKNPKIRNKAIFNSIANGLKQNFPDLSITGGIVQKKFYNMKRTYLDIVQKKNTNSKYPINWKFFNKVHDIMALSDLKGDYVTYEFDGDEIVYKDDELPAKKFKRDYSQPEMEDINFEEYVEYENVETYEIDEEPFNQEVELKTEDSRFSLEMEQHDDIEADEDNGNCRIIEEEIAQELESAEDIIEDYQLEETELEPSSEDLKQIPEVEEVEEIHQEPSSSMVEELPPHTSKNEQEQSSKDEITPFQRAILDLEGEFYNV